MSDAVPVCLHWPSNEDDLEEDWMAPAAGVPILILSDLGMSQPQSRQRVRWRRFAKKHLQKANTMTLSPAYRSPICEDSVRCLRPNPLWDLKLPKYAHQHGFSNPEIAKEKLAHILTLLSALPLVDTALLRKLRDKLDWGSSELEGLVWNHRDTISTGLGICIDPAAAEPYRKRYKKHCANTPEASLLWETVAKHHEDSYQGLKHFESLQSYCFRRRC